ncbi:MAG: hypothetical protein CSA53_08115, partial [Gammaproteobacteria bacterium]
MALFSQPTARALAIVDLLMSHPEKSFGLTEMTRRLSLNKATCHAILSTMATYGFLVQHPKTKTYRLGPSMIAAGNAAFAQFPVLDYARPTLEHLYQDLNLDYDIGFAVTGRSRKHVMLLAQYGRYNPVLHSLQLGMRLPNIAPIGACFMAWEPARAMENWLNEGHEAHGHMDEQLKQKLRASIIGIRTRGYEVTLKTPAERAMTQELMRIKDSWNLDMLNEATEQYQRELYGQNVHLDAINPVTKYEVSGISVPVFFDQNVPVVCFVAGAIEDPISGADIKMIASRLKTAAT